MENTKPEVFTASDALASELLRLGFTECHETIPVHRKFSKGGCGGLRIWVDQSYGLIDIVTLGGWSKTFQSLPAPALIYLAANGLSTATKKKTFLALAQTDGPSLERRLLLQATSAAFVDFMDCQERGERLYRNELLQKFREQQGYDDKAFTPERFGNWLRAYKQHGYDFEQGQDSRGQRWIQLPHKAVEGLAV